MPCPFAHLGLEDLPRLMRPREAKVRVDEMARQLGRHRSTICREIKRNGWHDAEVPQAEGYWPVSAQSLSDGRRRRRCKLLRHPALQAAVVKRLKDGWSPEQIAGRLKLEPGREHTLCHETIYRFVYSGSCTPTTARARSWPATCRSSVAPAGHAVAGSREASSFLKLRAFAAGPRR